jgi:hypothetical protein
MMRIFHLFFPVLVGFFVAVNTASSEPIHHEKHYSKGSGPLPTHTRWIVFRVQALRSWRCTAPTTVSRI